LIVPPLLRGTIKNDQFHRRAAGTAREQHRAGTAHRAKDFSPLQVVPGGRLNEIEPLLRLQDAETGIKFLYVTIGKRTNEIIFIEERCANG